jgi:hypothetical protein
MSVEVSVDFLYIHRVDAPATFLDIDVDAISEVSNRDGRIEVMAGGRRRAVFTEGHDTQLEVSCQQVSRADTDTFRTWAEEGAFLFFRDPRGRIVWGHIMSPTITETSAVDQTDITFSIRQITYTEAV